MLTEAQCDALLGKNDNLDDVVITDPVGDPTEATCRDWVRNVAAMGLEWDGDLVDVLESLLEATEQRWFVSRYMPKAQPVGVEYARLERKMIGHFLETGRWGEQCADELGESRAAIRKYLANSGFSMKRAQRNFGIDLMIDHPWWDTGQVRLAMTEFVPAVPQNTVHVWRFHRKDRPMSQLTARMIERGLLAEDAEGGVLSHTPPSVVGASA